MLHQSTRMLIETMCSTLRSEMTLLSLYLIPESLKLRKKALNRSLTLPISRRTPRRSKVQNKHPFPIDNLIIRNALPVTQDKRVRVVLRKPKELIEAKEGVLVQVK